jgi:hypothetical protein
MGALKLSIAVGDYDRMRPLMDGFVQIDGVDPIFLRLTPEEIFFRAMRHAEFDVATAPMSGCRCFRRAPSATPPSTSGLTEASTGPRTCAVAGSACRSISSPQTSGRARSLEEDHGVKASDITWVRAGLNQAGRVENVALQGEGPAGLGGEGSCYSCNRCSPDCRSFLPSSGSMMIRVDLAIRVHRNMFGGRVGQAYLRGQIESAHIA